jgi:hypothetical protein
MKVRLQSIVLSAGVLLLSPLVPAAAGQAASQAPAIRQIPGLTSKDAYPNGCVDCHVAGKDADMRISALMATWTKAVPVALAEKARSASVDASKIKGKHPAMANVKANVPQTCLAACHKPGSTIAPPFARLMHVIHLVGGNGNRFLTANQGECTHCHKLNPKTGAWNAASSAEK